MEEEKTPIKDLYSSTIRSVLVAFASLFDDITVRKYNADGTVSDVQQKVDIAFSDKTAYSLYCESLLTARNHDTKIADIGRRFPRLSFDFVGLNWDEANQIQPWLYKSKIENNTIARKAISPAAYSFDVVLSLWAKDMDTSIQVLEQILPFFKPEVAIRIKEQKELPVLNDILVILNGISKIDNYENGFNENRIIQWDLQFQIRANIWSHSVDGKPIKEIFIDLKDKKFNSL